MKCPLTWYPLTSSSSFIDSWIVWEDREAADSGGRCVSPCSKAW